MIPGLGGFRKAESRTLENRTSPNFTFTLLFSPFEDLRRFGGLPCVLTAVLDSENPPGIPI